MLTVGNWSGILDGGQVGGGVGVGSWGQIEQGTVGKWEVLFPNLAVDTHHLEALSPPFCLVTTL